MVNRFTCQLKILPKSAGIGVILMVAFNLFSCSSLRNPALDTRTVSLYNPGKTELHPEYAVYHSAEDESTLFFRVLARELLFNRANPENENRALIKIDYIQYSSYIDQKIDSQGEQEFVINADDIDEIFNGSIKIKTEKGKSYFLELTMTDQMRQSRKADFIFVDRYSPKSQQNYLVLSYPGNEVGYGKFYFSDEKFRIISNRVSSGKMSISYYKPFNILPRPPFTVDEPPPRAVSPDTVWEIEYDQQKLFQLPERGIYQFFPDREDFDGLYLVNLGDHFPQITTPEDMAPPLQYITTSEEYRNIIRQDELKKAVDDFWVKTGKDYDNARELIKVYYNRVLFANLYYTTDREGWKTDRGMIYLLMGPPEMVRKTETQEEWIYQSGDSRSRYRFDFALESDPVKNYDFALKRTENHRTVWNTAVQTWRDGRIFSL